MRLFEYVEEPGQGAAIVMELVDEPLRVPIERGMANAPRPWFAGQQRPRPPARPLAAPWRQHARYEPGGDEFACHHRTARHSRDDKFAR